MSSSLRRLFGYLFLFAALLIGGGMYMRHLDGALWSYAPLFLYLCLYGGVLLLLTFRKDESFSANNRLSTLSGLLLGLGFPGILPFPFLLLIALVPLLFLWRTLQRQDAGYGTFLAHGFNTFLLYNILASYWVTNTSFGAGVFAILVNSLLMCLPWSVLYWTNRYSPRVSFLAFAACWISFEYGHHNWELNWPWLTLGNGFAQWPSLIQWYEWTGVLGGSAWILTANYLLYRCFPAVGTARQPFWPLLAGLVLCLPLAGSLLRYATYVPGDVGKISVGAIQPGFEPHYEKFSLPRAAQLDTFLRLSRAALATAPLDYLVYPETSFRGIEEGDPLGSPVLRALRDELQELDLQYLVTGYSGYYVFAPDEVPSSAVRYDDRGRFAYEALNGALQLDLKTGATQTYRKGVFVPGPERFPFRKALFFLEDFVNSLGGTVAGLGTQDRRLPLEGTRARVAPVICYESVFGEYFTRYIQEGAQAVFVMTNDGWWDRTAGHRQHLWLSSLRAIETRREIVRSANTGICAFIDQRGTIRSRTTYGGSAWLTGEMTLNDATTFYVRRGNLIGRIALLLAGMVLLSNVARALRNSDPAAAR